MSTKRDDACCSQLRAGNAVLRHAAGSKPTISVQQKSGQIGGSVGLRQALFFLRTRRFSVFQSRASIANSSANSSNRIHPRSLQAMDRGWLGDDRIGIGQRGGHRGVLIPRRCPLANYPSSIGCNGGHTPTSYCPSGNSTRVDNAVTLSDCRSARLPNAPPERLTDSGEVGLDLGGVAGVWTIWPAPPSSFEARATFPSLFHQVHCPIGWPCR